MKKISFWLITTLLGTIFFSGITAAQQITPKKFIKVEDNETAEVCILHPTEINAHYKFAPQSQRSKGIPNTSASEINITYLDDCGGEVWPEDAKNAFQYAADIWESHLDTPIPIRIEANWVDLGENTLGSARPNGFFTLTGEGIFENTIYTVAQASALTEEDLVSQFDEISSDIVVNMNCAFPDWYMGTDANTPSGTLDAVTVLIHEIGHGIGFTGTMDGDPNTQLADWGFGQPLPFVYDIFTLDGSFRQLIDTDIFSKPSEELYDALTGQDGGVFFGGTEAEFSLDDMRVPLYSPEPYVPGSSYSHLDQQFFSNTPNALMRPQLDRALAVHSPGPVFCGLLNDMGWPIGPDCEALIPDEGFLDRPVLATPTNGAGSHPVNPTLNWNEVSGATQYKVQLTTDFDFNDIVLEETVATTTFAVEQMLEFNTLYFWRVQAISAGGDSKFSGKFRFTTATDPPDAITLLTPEDGATQLFPGFELTWQAADRADEYQFQISKSEDFSPVMLDRTVSVPRFGATQFLDFSTTYYWRVRGLNAAGPGEWSMMRSFTTIIEKPDPVSLSTPGDNENQVSVNAALTWMESARASEYMIQISEDESFSSEPLIELTSSEPSISLVNPLQYATIYHWRVKATNIGGESDWSAARTFTSVVQETAIRPNYPNPFNSTTTVRFQLSEQSDVVLDIYDMVGRRVATLVNEERPAGVYFEQLQAAGYASGAYFIRFAAGDFMEVQKMAIIK